MIISTCDYLPVICFCLGFSTFKYLFFEYFYFDYICACFSWNFRLRRMRKLNRINRLPQTVKDYEGFVSSHHSSGIRHVRLSSQNVSIYSLVSECVRKRSSMRNLSIAYFSSAAELFLLTLLSWLFIRLQGLSACVERLQWSWRCLN